MKCRFYHDKYFCTNKVIPRAVLQCGMKVCKQVVDNKRCEYYKKGEQNA